MTMAKAKLDTMEILGWWMAPLRSIADGRTYKHYNPTIVYAHNLEHAFSEIRRCHPIADGWICLGGVRASDTECVVEIPETGTYMTLQMVTPEK